MDVTNSYLDAGIGNFLTANMGAANVSGAMTVNNSSGANGLTINGPGGQAFLTGFGTGNIYWDIPGTWYVENGGGLSVAASSANRGMTPGFLFEVKGQAMFDNFLWSTNGYGSFNANKIALPLITVGPSPFNYTWSGNQNATIFIGGGTVSQITVNTTPLPGTYSGQTLAIPVQPGESIVVTYSGLPTMRYKPF